MNHAIAERLRRVHGLTVTVQPLDGALRRYDPADARADTCRRSLPRESRGFHMAFQLALLEAREAVEAVLADAAPSSPEAGMLIRVGLLNYVAGALLMPYAAFLDAARTLRHDMEALAARFGVSFEQACHRLSTLQRQGARGVPFFFVRVDPAGNVSKRFSAAGFPFARYGGSCPRWVVHTAFSQPGAVQVQVAELPDGAAYLCFARTVTRPARTWGDPRPTHVVAMGCGIAHADDRGICRRAGPGAVRRSASACPAACAIAPTAAAAPFRRWSIGWHSTQRPRASRHTGSKRDEGEMEPLHDTMAEWHDFFVLLGTAAGTLVALLFVAASVSSGVFSLERRAPLRMFLTATVVHFSSVLAVSLIMLLPLASWLLLGIIVLVCGSVGLGYSVLAVRDSIRDGLIANVDWEDRTWYGVLPFLAYLIELAAGIVLACGAAAGCAVLAACMGLLLIVGIHNAWDITVWTISRRQE